MDRIGTFKTATLEVFCDAEPEQDSDLSWADEETLHQIEMGVLQEICWHVGVKVNGELYADSYLGCSVYENPADFTKEHLGMNGKSYGSYFADMVHECLRETRRKLAREEENARRAAR